MIAHEFAHVMTFQDIMTYSGYLFENKRISDFYVEGVSGYADAHSDDGAETIAEAFVRMRNNEKVPDRARELVEQYIMRWKR